MDSRAVPAAESLPAGAEIDPPKPPPTYPDTNVDSPAKATTPIVSATAGRFRMRVAIAPQAPVEEMPTRVFDGQKAARPKIASSAGVSVRPASRATPMPMASGMPRLE